MADQKLNGSHGPKKSNARPLAQEIENLRFDKRMTELNLKHGRMTKEELKKHLDSLEDLTNQSEIMKIEGELFSH